MNSKVLTCFALSTYFVCPVFELKTSEKAYLLKACPTYP